MQFLPFTCDQCKTRMGLMIFPDGVDAETFKLIFQAVSITVLCPECDPLMKKERREVQAKLQKLNEKQVESSKAGTAD